MKITSSYICLNEVHFHAYHGVMPQERKVGAEFLLSIRVGYDFSNAMHTDEVCDTLSYAEVYQLVKQEMKQPSALLEHVAGRIMNTLVEHFPTIKSIDLSLTKLNPPMGADCKGASVELHLINDKTGV